MTPQELLNDEQYKYSRKRPTTKSTNMLDGAIADLSEAIDAIYRE
jgi:hypothetical protein